MDRIWQTMSLFVLKNQTLNKLFKNRGWLLFLIPPLVFSIFGFKNLGLPGLYMDSVNPDYMAAWMQRGGANIPAWLFPDNCLAGMYKLPLLNSLYGGNSSAYLAFLFFKVFGFGAVEVRLFHSLLAISVLLSLSWCLWKWRVPEFAVVLFGCLLASDPSYIFAWRTQYYLQLYPLVWLFLGVGLLGSFFLDGADDGKMVKQLKILLAGAFIGFSAYSYFVFAIYAVSIAIILFFATKKNGTKPFICLIKGILIGFSPYIYAHASIVFNTGFSSYVRQIKTLQTAYGVVDVNQGGLIERLGTVASRLEQLVLGRGVEITIFGTSEPPIFASLIALSFLLFFLVFYRPYFLDLHKVSHENSELDRRSHLSLLATFVLVCILSHLMFGLAIGRPLGLQHYIMVLPLAYFACAVLFSEILYIEGSKLIKIAIKSIALAFMLFILIINILSGYRISSRLAQEGGNGLYSDAINTAGLYLESLPTKTILLFPQWGYWMGEVIIAGPRHSVFEAPNLEEMERRLKSDPELQNGNSFVLVLGQDFFRGDDMDVNFKGFAERNGLLLKDVTTIYGRNSVDKVKLVHMLRRERSIQ